MKKIMTIKNTIFYTTCDDAYVRHAIVSLLSIRKFVPKVKLGIIGRFFSIKSKCLMRKHQIEYVEVDLRDSITKTWDYPLECYYIFYGPQYYQNSGLTYSVYVDADVVCCQNPLIRPFPGIAGMSPSSIRAIFGDDYAKLKKHFNINKRAAASGRVQSGVVYFNNEMMSSLDLLGKTSELFQRCLQCDAPRKGVDSLLSLFQALYLPNKLSRMLGMRYNFIPQFANGEEDLNSIIFFHFTSIPKPWSKTIDKRYRRFYAIWQKQYLKTYKRPLIQELAKINTLQRKAIRDIKNTLSGQRLGYFERVKNCRKSPLKTYWFQDGENGIYNFGDEISSILIPKITGRNVIMSSMEDCNLVAVGSLMELVLKRESKSPVAIWGTGFISNGKPCKLSKNVKVLAVRGRSTLKRIDRSNIPLGDAGIFANIIYPKEKSTYTGKIGMIAHYADRDSETLKKVRKNSDYLIINPLDPPEQVAREISGCKFILSSSLHGLIFADSYNIPNAHVVLSDKVIGGDYKFRDYCSGVGRKYITVKESDILDAAKIERIAKGYHKLTKLPMIRKTLLAALKEVI